MEKQKDITNEKILDNLNDLQNQKIVLDAEERVNSIFDTYSGKKFLWSRWITNKNK